MPSIAPPTTRGPQNPGKYPRTGPSYAHWGEQPGFIYNYITDRYVVDPKAQDQFERDNGLKQDPPKPPSPGGQLATAIGGTAAGIAVAEATRRGVQSALADSPTPTPDVSGGLIPKPNAGAAGPTAPTGATAPTPGATPPPAPAGTSGGLIPTTPNTGAVAPTAVGTGPTPGSTLMSDGSIANANGTVTAADGVIVDPQAGTAVKPDGTPVEGTNVGAYVQGALGVVQVIGGVQQFQNGDKFGGGLNVAAGGANVAAASGAELGGAVVPGLNIATGLYSGYKTAQMVGNAPAGAARNRNAATGGALAGASVGAGVGSIVPVVGTAVGAVVGAVVGAAAGLASSYFGSDKDKYQMIRDGGRKFLIENKIIDDKYQGTLADGTKFDFGKDGKGQQRLDFDNAATGKAAALGDVIAAGEGFFGRSREAMSTLYTGAALSNGKDEATAKANMLHFWKQRGFTVDTVQAQLNKQLEEGNITKDEHAAYSNTLKTNFGTSQPAPGTKAPPGVAPLQPGQTPASTAAAANGAPAPSNGLLPTRSGTSPGFDKNGRRITYGNS